MCQTNYLSMLDAIVDMQTRGFFFDFSLIGNKLLCAQQKLFLSSEEFEILEMYRFQHDDHTRQETVIYGIQSMTHHVKGILLSPVYKRTTPMPPILSKKISKFRV